MRKLKSIVFTEDVPVDRDQCNGCWIERWCYYRQNTKTTTKQFKCSCCGVERPCPNMMHYPQTKSLDLCAICFYLIRAIQNHLNKLTVLEDGSILVKLNRGARLYGGLEFYVLSDDIITCIKKEVNKKK